MYEYNLFNHMLVGTFTGQVLDREITLFTKEITDLLAENKSLFVVITTMHLEDTNTLNDLLASVINLSASNSCLKSIYILSEETQHNLSAIKHFQKLGFDEVKVRRAYTLDKLFRLLEEDASNYPALKTSLTNKLPDVHKFIYEVEQNYALLPLCADNL